MRISIIGAGLFGCMAAIKLSEKGYSVDLIERMDDILLGASKHNHNRIHRGYHYLRSIQTAKESLEGLSTFTETFGNAIRTEFPNYYCIAAQNSKTTPERFEEFCQIVQIEYKPEFPAPVLLNRDVIAQCYRVPEPVCDYFMMCDTVRKLLQESKVQLHLNTTVQKIERDGIRFLVHTNSFSQEYDVLVNATYSELNTINKMVGVPQRTYLYEDVVIPVFRCEQSPIGITVMDGEFCSIMPRGYRENEFLLYHVKHSLLSRRLDNEGIRHIDPLKDDSFLFEESSYFMPFLKNQRSFDRYQCVRVVFENDDDARRSLLYNDLPNYWSLLSGKLTTCVDIANKLVDQINGANYR